LDISRLWDATRDYARRVWVNSAEDDIFFLAGGIAFNILLAAVPFVLLVIAGLTYALELSPDASFAEVSVLLDRFLPSHTEGPDAPVHVLLHDVIAARGALGLWGAVTFVWFSTRLFGSLRSVLAEVFDIETPRGIIAGKWFDVRMTVISTALLVAYAALSTYLALASSRGISFLVQLGLRQEVMGGVEYAVGRLVAFGFIVASFWALYKYLPHRKVRWQQALVGALASSLLLEVARNAWSALTQSFNMASLYTGTLYALVSLVFWVYYAALIFIVGAEVSQAHELRRTRRLQRESLN
jgi:membrane protein